MNPLGTWSMYLNRGHHPGNTKVAQTSKASVRPQQGTKQPSPGGPKDSASWQEVDAFS